MTGERDLRLVAGIISGLTGAMMLIVPDQFSFPAYVLVAAHITWWGMAFLLSDLGLPAVIVLQPRKPVPVVFHLLVGAAWLFLAFGYLRGGGWTGMAGWGVFGLGIASAPFLSRQSAGTAVSAAPSQLYLL